MNTIVSDTSARERIALIVDPEALTYTWQGDDDQQAAERMKACRERRAQWGEDDCEERDGACHECSVDMAKALETPASRARRKDALAKADAILASLPSLSGEWEPIETAPKDGTHFLACGDRYSQHWGFNQSPPMVVHWWDNPGEEGFYLSSGATGLDDEPLAVKNWRPLPAPPAMLSATPSSDGERG